MLENFNAAYYTANLLYDLELKPEEFEEIGLIAWNKIGNRRTRLYRYTTSIQCPDNTVELPCNCDIVEAVTYNLKSGTTLLMTQLTEIMLHNLLRII